MGILVRGKDGKPGQIRTTVVPDRKKKALQAKVREHVAAGSALYTDALKSYKGLNEFEHQVIDHAVEYVNGSVPHERPGKLLESFEARIARHVCFGRAVLPVPVPG
jgi:hypothetical protein